MSPETPLVVHGLSRLVAEPEFHSAAELRPLLELIDDQPSAVVSATDQPGVWIGEEHPQKALQACSVVQAPYHCGQEGVGQVALVGPMAASPAWHRAPKCMASRSVTMRVPAPSTTSSPVVKPRGVQDLL